MRRAWNHDNLIWTVQLGSGMSVQLQHFLIAAANNQKRWCADSGEIVFREVGTSPARNNRHHGVGPTCGGDKCCAGSRACPEVSDWQRTAGRLPGQPVRRRLEPSGQERDVEHLLPIVFFLFFQQIDEQRRHAVSLEDASDVLISRAKPATPAAVGEHHGSLRADWNPQDADQSAAATGDFDETLFSLGVCRLESHDLSSASVEQSRRSSNLFDLFQSLYP